MSNPKFSAKPFNSSRVLEVVDRTLQIEADAILSLKNRISSDLSYSLTRSIDLLLNCHGKIIVSGLGKSGHIARKIAATLASTGTPALFIHPAEAAHGDLSMVTKEDIFIAISNSGETKELTLIIPLIKRIGASFIAMTGNNNSSLASCADIYLDVRVNQEACTLNLVPTASTTTALAMGDALAIALLDARGFREEDFARSHPGGALGRRLLTHVRDIMRSGKLIPCVTKEVLLPSALIEITSKGVAMTAVVDENFFAIGILTDGDLRRLMEQGENFTSLKVADVMNNNPYRIGPEKLVTDAAYMMRELRINQLLVTNKAGILVGALHVHDLTDPKII